MKFEWSDEKNRLNIKKHNISFEEAKEVFLDPMQISKFDDYEMLDEYDFSGGIRGRFYEPKKIPVSLILDNDIVLFFKKLASEQKVPYQTLINTMLIKKLQEI
ncbi:MAG: BrnT family toxin [Sulfurovum sp.]